MAKINLLPWREERREQLKKEFLTILGVVALLSAGLVALGGYLSNAWADNQNDRNRYLTTKINDLNKQVTEISDLEERRESLLERMEIIQALQGNRPVIVRVFDELVRTIPDGTYYQTLARQRGTVTVSGLAESSNRISSLMRKLDSSDWFKEPNLSNVKANESIGEEGNEFELTVQIDTPGSEDEEEQ